MKIILNPDETFVRNLKKRIKANNSYCPCKQEKKPENKCPCKDFRDNQDCRCGLYIRVSDGGDE